MRWAAATIVISVMSLSGPALSQQLGDDWGVDIESFLLGTYSRRTSGETPEGHEFLLAEERLRLDLSVWSENIEAEARVKLDGAHDSIAGEFDIDLREAYLDYSVGNLDLRLGRQIATWGVGDLLFINDVFPKDWVSFFSGRPLEYLKLGVDSARVNYSTSALNVEFMIVTDFRPDTLPTPRRFFLHDDFSSIAERMQVHPDTGLDNPELALRMYRQIGGFDASAYAYRGYWRSPGQAPDDYDVPNQVTHFFPRLSVYGISAQGQAMGGILSLEGGYYDSRDDNAGIIPAIANSEVRFLLGYQRQLSEDFTIGVQYFAEVMMDFDAYERTLPTVSTPRNKYRDIATVRLTRFLKHQTWMLSLFTFYSPAEQDYLLQPQLDYKVSDAFSTTLGANLFGGKKQTTFLGQFDRNDNLYLTLRYDF
ncbi:MAG: hypothetical protein GY783_14425 [Gammaproteobacteria bacterium]|nr:hypothetical protein [Gammaproteobacteria bacterium]